MTEPQHIIITGNPVDGFQFTGPFTTHDDAVREADDSGSDWWVADLTVPTVTEPVPHWSDLLPELCLADDPNEVGMTCSLRANHPGTIHAALDGNGDLLSTWESAEGDRPEQ